MPTQILSSFLSVIDGAYNNLQPYAMKLLYMLLALNITTLGIFIAMGRHNNLGELIEKLLVMGVFVYLVSNFKSLAFMFLNSVTGLASGATSIGKTAVNNPTSILSFAHQYVIDPYTNAMDAFWKENTGRAGNSIPAQITQVVATLSNLKYTILYFIFLIAVMVCFIIVMVQVILASLEFHIVMFFALLVLPFSVWEPLSFIGKNAFTSVIAQALRMAIIVFITAVGLQVFKSYFQSISYNENPSAIIQNFGFEFSIIGSCALFAYLVIAGPTLALSVLSGSPMLGAGGFASTMSNIGRGVQGLVSGLRGGGGGAGAREGSAQTEKETRSQSQAQQPSAGSTAQTTSTAGGQFQSKARGVDPNAAVAGSQTKGLPAPESKSSEGAGSSFQNKSAGPANTYFG